jgi:hypothetical protein
VWFTYHLISFAGIFCLRVQNLHGNNVIGHVATIYQRPSRISQIQELHHFGQLDYISRTGNTQKMHNVVVHLKGWVLNGWLKTEESSESRFLFRFDRAVFTVTAAVQNLLFFESLKMEKLLTSDCSRLVILHF